MSFSTSLTSCTIPFLSSNLSPIVRSKVLHALPFTFGYLLAVQIFSECFMFLNGLMVELKISPMAREILCLNLARQYVPKRCELSRIAEQLDQLFSLAKIVESLTMKHCGGNFAVQDKTRCVSLPL